MQVTGLLELFHMSMCKTFLLNRMFESIPRIETGMWLFSISGGSLCGRP